MEEFEHTMPIEQLLEKIGISNIKTGITEQQLMNRLEKDGYNLPQKPGLVTTIRLTILENLIFILYVVNLTALLITLSDKGPSVTLSHLTIIAFTFVAHMIDLFMVDKPKIPKFGSLIAVIRNGKSNVVDSKFLVRGDVVELEQSMISPADIRLVKVNNMIVNGNILLGKEGIRLASAAGSGDFMSSPNMILQGFTVETGKAIGIVLRTGKQTVLSNSSVQTTGVSRFEVYFFIIFSVLLALSCCLNYYLKFDNFQGFLVLSLVLTKFPHMIKKGHGLFLLTISHLLISSQVYPKTVKSYSSLSSSKYLVYDIRDSLITTKKEVKKLYINDSLQNTSSIKPSPTFDKLLALANFSVFKEPETEQKQENVPLEDWDPRPKEKEYEHPVEVTLRSFLSSFNLQKPENAEHLKIPLTSKNKNSLAVVTPKDSSPVAILLGEARDVINNCKSMWVNGKNTVLPSKSILSLCEDLTLEGNLCIALAFSEIDPSVIKEGEELKPDVFEFSLLGVFIIKEYTEDCQGTLEVAKELGINMIGIGREGKDYLLNLAYSSKLITDPPEDYNNEHSNCQNIIMTPAQALKDFKVSQKFNVFVPNLNSFDLCALLGEMKDVIYVGNNQIALQLSKVGATFVGSQKELKEVSNFVLLSNKPLPDLLDCIKRLKGFGDHDFFFMLEHLGCFIPAVSYLIFTSLFSVKTSSFAVLLIDFSVPLASQFLWIGFPKKGYVNPLAYWVLVALCGLYSFNLSKNEGLDDKFCNFSYFFSVFFCGIFKILYLQMFNWKTSNTAWLYAYLLPIMKLMLFWLYCSIRFVSSKNSLESHNIVHLFPSLLLFWVSLFSLYLLRSR